MNILNRIKKLESRIEVGDGIHCHCYTGADYHLLVPALDGNPNGYCETHHGNCIVDLDSVCDKCGKPVFVQVIKPRLEENEYEH